MKLSRILIAAIVGGLVTFIWGAVDHMATPLGKMGLKSLPDAQSQMIMNAMNFSLKERGFYMFPACDEKGIESKSKDVQEKAWNAYCDKYAAGPRGAIIFDPEPGIKAMSPKMLGIEFASNVGAAFFLACIIAMAGGRAGRGAMIGAAAGLFAAMSIDLSYWNWYRTPLDMAMASHVEQMVGGLLTGFVIGLILGRPKAAPAMM